MNISFDLDDLIIPGVKQFDVEQQNIIHTILKLEKIRKGTLQLFRTLQRQNHKVFIYTSSLRSTFKIRLNFLIHGILLDDIFNKKAHDNGIKYFKFNCSKYPPMFNIDIHVDDSEGVKIESEKYGFKVVIIQEKDVEWVQTVLKAVNDTELKPSN